MIKATEVQELRAKTGAGLMDCKKALTEAKGDMAKALEVLKKKDAKIAAKKSDRDASEGVVGTYLHTNHKIGVLVEVNCETDFVARNEEFRTFVHDLAVHIAAANPQVIKPEDVTAEMLTEQKKIWEQEMAKDNKPKEIMEKAMAGKEKKYKEEIALLTQSFYKDQEKTVGDVVTEKTGKIGERIEVARFVRYQM
ncbi:MAG: translation elongation factor Ts [bacterium]